jgi:hypothetical protein
MDELIKGEVENKILQISKQSDQFFVTNMAAVQANHSRCGQVLDKRIAEFDLEEARSASAMDPMTTSFLLSKTVADNGAVSINVGTLLEVLRTIQK